MAQTRRQMANNQQRTLETMQRRLLSMAAAWAEIDPYNQRDLDELARDCALLAERLPLFHGDEGD